MRNTVRKGLLLAFLGSVSAGSVSAQIKVEAESAVKMHSEKTEIILENEKKSVGYFDEVGEYMTYEVNIPEAGLYQFSFKYLTGKDGDLKIEGPDGGSSIFPIEANHLTANWWELPMGSWPEFDFDQSALYYFEAGKQTFTVHNTGWALNIDYFSLKKSSATDSKVVSVKTSPNKVELMPNESVLITPMAFNAEGQMLAAAATWSANAKDGVYKSGSSTGADVVTVSMGGVEKKVNVKIAKPSKKQEFVVTKHGKLNTKGGAVCDASGNKVSLMGPSFFWSCSAPLWWTKETVNHLVKNYNIQIIRLPVSIAPGDNTWTDHSATWNEDNYLHRPEYTRALVDEMVKAAIENDIYVIIDFHEHYAQHWVDLSKDFFTYFATKWGEYPNVMYEIYNEPMTDNGTVVNYAKEIIPVIRKIDDDNIIIVGSTQYSREPDNVTAAGSGYSNIAYTWHGYVEWGHQSDWNGKNTWNNGVPIVVTEWGLNWSKNDGGLINLYKEKSLINCFWSMSNKGGDDAK
ncbi:MAG: cellulase family glycosylhydrolase, partial [Paludibacteraceae bacterium]|nr:cellulase family glycosylhydrolase [Paludibacteraceae bacterium]